MFFIKKSRYKPLYKKFLNLRKNVQNRKKLFNFKKKKWQKFLSFLSRSLRTGKKNYRIYDHNKYFLPKYGHVYKKKFKNNLVTKQKFSLYYGYLLDKHINRCVKKAVKKKKFQRTFLNFNLIFIEILESRLDTILYRSHFLTSIRSARQLIINGHVKVNSKTILCKSFLLKKGDRIEINPTFFKYLENNVRSSQLLPLLPNNLSINYKTFQIVVIDNIKFSNLSNSFLFSLNLNEIINYYSLR